MINRFTKIQLFGDTTYCSKGLALYATIDFDTCSELIVYDHKKKELIDKVKFPSNYVFVIINPICKKSNLKTRCILGKPNCKKIISSINIIYPHVKTLRDVSTLILKNTKNLLDVIDYRKTLYIVLENDLVLKGMQALKNNDIHLFGQYLYISYESYKNNLNNSSRELNYLTELSKSIPGCIGAKLSGDNYNKSIQIVNKKELQKYNERISTAFKLQTGAEPLIRTFPGREANCF